MDRFKAFDESGGSALLHWLSFVALLICAVCMDFLEEMCIGVNIVERWTTAAA